MLTETRLQELVQHWQEMRRAGRAITVQQFCDEEKCPPDLAAALQRQLRQDEETILSIGETTFPPPTESFSADESSRRPLENSTVFGVSLFEALRFHAEGALGEVYTAREDELGRDVALKFIKPEQEFDQRNKDQFRVEAEVTAQLDHPGVVPMYGLGYTTDGRLFHVMRFVRGETFSREIDAYHEAVKDGADTAQLRVQFRNLISRFVSVCNTIAFAHNRGIVHRDIKPDNIMLGKYGETLVVDWGLARPFKRDERARASGERTLVPGSADTTVKFAVGIVGTPAYMSPEQAAGMPNIGPATDIYSLGATLYKLLTGLPPIQAPNLREALDRVQSGKFPRPCEVSSHAPRSLESICLKAMANAPQDRYPTVLELAQDLESWLADEPVTVYQESLAQRLARWVRRHRGWALGATFAGIAIILTSTVSAVWLGKMARRERTARSAADHAREQGLSMAARFAAKTVASEIDLRWRILEAEAADSELQNLLQSAKSSIDEEIKEDLANWLNERYISHSASTKATSWFITDDEGIQLARSPKPKHDTIGKSYRWRDYFHGAGRDLTEEEARDKEPTPHVHRSTVFQSQANGNLMVAFSVPIWGNRNAVPIGILAMTVELGRFSVLQAGLGTNQLAVLVETNEDRIEQQPRKGLILHHRRFRDLRRTGHADDLPVFRLESSLVDELLQLRKTRMRQQRFEEQSPWELNAGDVVRRDYRDPVGGSANERWLAAFEPVLVKGRSREENQDIGWVVIVQELQFDADTTGMPLGQP